MNLFFEILQVSLGNRKHLSRLPSEDEWLEMLQEAKRQAVSGVFLSGVEELPKNQWPSKVFLLKCVGSARNVERQSKLNEQRSFELSTLFREKGFENCIIKGHGVSRLYPNPYRRPCGDIDLWVGGKRKDVMSWLSRRYKMNYPVWHNVSVRIFEDMPVEIHFHPSWSYNPMLNWRLQRFYKKEQALLMQKGQSPINYPSPYFNAVMCLSHLYRHLIAEGVGMRHVVDYYYITSALTPAEKIEVVRQIKKLGLYHFLRGLMAVLHHCLGMPKEQLLCSPDAKEGKFLLKEFMASGNFGKHREDDSPQKNSIRRYLLMLRHFPDEVMWIVPWKIWHTFWRISNRHWRTASKVNWAEKDAFLNLVRLGIGNQESYPNTPKAIKWKQFWPLTMDQELMAVILDGIDKTEGAIAVPPTLLEKWIMAVLLGHENRYDEYRKTIAEMSSLYASEGIKMMLLKGYICSLDWPRPSHRQMGDIDIWNFGKYKEADDLVGREKGIEIDNSRHHHTVYQWGDFMVENHYDFINVFHHRSSPKLEMVFKELGKDDSRFIEVDGQKIYVPSPNLNALFLIKHTSSHFAAGGICLRNLLDWGFFVRAHHSEVDWPWLIEKVDEFGMKEIFNIFNSICIEDLGFEAELFPEVKCNPAMKERVLNDILYPEFPKEMPKNPIVRLIWKLRRWKANTWKHKLCYKESLLSAFFVGLWGHFIKPSSFLD